jgi:hypothetical protein
MCEDPTACALILINSHATLRDRCRHIVAHIVVRDRLANARFGAVGEMMATSTTSLHRSTVSTVVP